MAQFELTLLKPFLRQAELLKCFIDEANGWVEKIRGKID
jgi:hypothetical protein